MAYSEKAKELRRYRQRCQDGRPCRNWAVWGNDLRLCAPHAYKTRWKEKEEGRDWNGYRSKARCDCPAYQFPHRPGGGHCRFPDPPIYTCPTPAGTHSLPRKRESDRQIVARMLAEMGL